MLRLNDFFTTLFIGGIILLTPVNCVYAQINQQLQQFFANPSAYQNRQNQSNTWQNSQRNRWQQNNYPQQWQAQQNYQGQQRINVYYNGNPWNATPPYYYSPYYYPPYYNSPYYHSPYYYPYPATQIWVWSAIGEIPQNAVVYKNVNGMALYYCRVFLDSNVYSGVMVSNEGCYVQFDDQNVRYSNYQVLVTLGY